MAEADNKTKTMIKKLLLIVWAGILAASFTATAQNWQLQDTKTYGAGGAWENGQKVRIERSYRSGTFSFERKVSEGSSLVVFSSKGVFSALKKEYAPGEALTVEVSVSAKGSAAAAPALTYGRVTLIPNAPEWSKSRIIKGSDTVDGQLTADNGRTVASPDTGETVKLQLSGTMPARGTRVAVIFSCNGMDVVQVYTRDASMDTPAMEEPSEEVPVEELEEAHMPEETPVQEEIEETTPVEAIFDRSYPEPIPDELETVGLPLGKIIMLAGLAILAIVDLLWMFRKRRK